ncbi:hypothetical protein AVEN_232638-1 [Araneus ventricosus]|uniref:Uncharacterized protein n=1 Tax=Araneus ventricosus TaxID=182803 RepID=A0A4Y2SC59_ARAVE|nr:hypothetical protein AVEN_232638-1 [Araneus ventricosus]
MKLRQWTTNSPPLLDMWNETDLECRQSDSDIPLKVLALIWDNKNDTLKVALNQMQQLSDKITTKGVALSVCGVPCDPLDILTPFTVRIKLLIQKVWENGFTWDKPLPPDIEFMEWPHELSFVQDVVVPHLHSSVMKTELLEVDKSSGASHKVYCSVDNFRMKHPNDVKANFIVSKPRLTFLRTVTLPRPEFLRSVALARLCVYLSKTFPLIKEVLLGEEKVPRQLWRLGKITDVHKGRDGKHFRDISQSAENPHQYKEGNPMDVDVCKSKQLKQTSIHSLLVDKNHYGRGVKRQSLRKEGNKDSSERSRVSDDLLAIPGPSGVQHVNTVSGIHADSDSSKRNMVTEDMLTIPGPSGVQHVNTVSDSHDDSGIIIHKKRSSLCIKYQGEQIIFETNVNPSGFASSVWGLLLINLINTVRRLITEILKRSTVGLSP